MSDKEELTETPPPEVSPEAPEASDDEVAEAVAPEEEEASALCGAWSQIRGIFWLAYSRHYCLSSSGPFFNRENRDYTGDLVSWTF